MSAMDVVLFLVPMTLVLLGIGVLVFSWALRRGQYEDLDTPASRIIIDDREEQARQDRGQPPP